MPKASTAKKEWKNWSWASPKGKVWTKGTYATKAEASYAAEEFYSYGEYKVVPVLVSVK